MPVAVIGIALAVIEFYRDKKDAENDKKLQAAIDAGIGNGDDEDGI